ncbi:MAG: peptide chain release factor 2 [Armatimonadetes bacterium]|nr:peptide chain release factor 2 [Armatimonadota bacterium]
MLDDLRSRQAALAKRAGEMAGYLGLEDKRVRILELTAQTEQPGFWDDQQKAQDSLRALSKEKAGVEPWDQLLSRLEDNTVLIDLAEEAGDDEETAAEAEAEVLACEAELGKLEVAAMLSGPYDDHDAILQLAVGAGGTDASDWTEMLLRMFTRYAERQKFTYEILEYAEAEEAGVRSATIKVKGRNAYGLLRGEGGVHRLVRISPFDSNARRQTSFAGVVVIPDVADEIDVEIDEQYLRVDTYRASGAGGQHVNKTDSAVRLTYQLPGFDKPIVVSCQNERSQHKNRASAMSVLKAKIYEIMVRQKAERLEDLRGKVEDFAWGNQTRNYVLAPYRMVKDLRTNVETGDTDGVLDGDLDRFIEAYLRQNAGEHA